ncbi:MAG: zinc ribbon domain-containing protein [Candidatus Rokubacteria bacterium]|nr:zinc ribbon domain-containing protein [Candidatus Rokubacteria bacterium]
MECSRCQHDAPRDAAFCPRCGARLSLVCAECGTSNPPDHNFCKQCGQRLTSASPPPPVAPQCQSPQSYTPKHLA